MELFRGNKDNSLSQIKEAILSKDVELEVIFGINEFKNPSTKILFDMATIYKNYNKFEKAIEYYSTVLSKIDENSGNYAIHYDMPGINTYFIFKNKIRI